MSLLLDALKRAEQARQKAQGGGGDAQEPSRDPAGQVESRVRTRDELPDISNPIEILNDDLNEESARPRNERGPSPMDEPPARGFQTPSQRASRAAASQVFEAKLPFREADPHLPFRITLALLGLFTVGTMVYFWLQLRMPAPLVNPNPLRPGGELRSAGAQPLAQTGVVPESSPAPAARSTDSPVASAEVAARPPVTRAVARASPAKVEGALPLRSTRAARSLADVPLGAAALPDDSVRRANRTEPTIHPLVAAGYEAYQVGNFAAAREAYERALREEHDNRDALLGLAAAEMRLGHLDAAETLYMRRLHADPRDPHAQAGLLALRGALVDPIAAETRVKTLLAANPEAHVLHFTLGNQLAQQGRWSEAQQAYFRAYGADPENPDFAYNLAVSLDQLRQTKVALDYYLRAIALAGKRGAAFDAQKARLRVQELTRRAD